MLPQVLTKDFLQREETGAFKFIEWYNESDKETITQVSIEVFFDLDFTIQIGYYLEWLLVNGIVIVHHKNPLRKGIELKLLYTANPKIEFKYCDLGSVVVDHFTHNPLEAYEVLIAMFIERLKFPF